LKGLEKTSPTVPASSASDDPAMSIPATFAVPDSLPR